MIVRGYIKAIKESAISKQSFTPEVEKWILWAIKKADWLDPTIEETDPLLSDLRIDNNPFVMKREKNPIRI
ncbi:MAG: hypothetical protein KAR14_11475 [Candidatus Aminicenantes bacterium]|nr:hypothetical protein [Candidatus Aminicenantes bacterium]